MSRGIFGRILSQPLARNRLDGAHLWRGAQFAPGGRAAAVLLGDSVADIQAARAAGVRSVGYGKNPRRFGELESAGADATVGSISDLVTALHSRPVHASLINEGKSRSASKGHGSRVVHPTCSP